MYKVTIPKPCHENWNAMLPVEKGRFCDSCNKTVIDFQAISDAQVQDYIKDNYANKICGQFARNQLHELVVEIKPINLPRNSSIYKRIAYIAFIIFGTTLFSCTNNNGDAVTKIVLADSVKMDARDTQSCVKGNPMIGAVDYQQTVDSIEMPNPGEVVLVRKKKNTIKSE
jgi:hypothetical protein